MYPLRFKPLFRRYLWGGRQLADVLNKPIGDQKAAESWEIVDHAEDQSEVAFGALAGRTLHELVVEFDVDLVGDQVWQQLNDPSLPANLQLRFPLLLKFLDANQHLSVQVHPDNHLGAKLSPPDLGKTEAWYVMHAQPGSKIFAGLKDGVTEADFRTAVDAGQTESMLHSFEPQTGDCVFVAAGTMHAIGAGLLIAEIQQASNTTYRVFDWNRVDDQGNGRPLHIEQAMEATHFSGPVNAIAPKALDGAGQEMLVECERFEMRRLSFSNTVKIGGDGKFRLLAVVEGQVEVEGDPAETPMKLADTMLLPACLAPTEIRNLAASECQLLEITVP